MKKDMLKVMIVDDQQLFLDLLEQMLKSAENIEIVCRALNGDEAIVAAKKYCPDVILMDICMPICNGIEAIKAIKEYAPDRKILALTSSSEDADVVEAILSGANGYIRKTSGKEELLIAIKGVYHGLGIIDSSIKEIIHRAQSRNNDVPLAKKKVLVNQIEKTLSEREISIMRMIVEGKNTSEIAEKLFISKGRLRNIITSLLSKLMLSDRTQLAVFAIRNGLA